MKRIHTRVGERMDRVPVRIAEEEQSRTRQVTVSDVEDYLEEAEHRWKKAPRAWTAFHTEMDMSEKARKCITAEGLEDLSV